MQVTRRQAITSALASIVAPSIFNMEDIADVCPTEAAGDATTAIAPTLSRDLVHEKIKTIIQERLSGIMPKGFLDSNIKQACQFYDTYENRPAVELSLGSSTPSCFSALVAKPFHAAQTEFFSMVEEFCESWEYVSQMT